SLGLPLRDTRIQIAVYRASHPKPPSPVRFCGFEVLLSVVAARWARRPSDLRRRPLRVRPGAGRPDAHHGAVLSYRHTTSEFRKDGRALEGRGSSPLRRLKQLKDSGERDVNPIGPAIQLVTELIKGLFE